MKIFLNLEIFNQKCRGQFCAENIILYYGKEYTYFLLPPLQYSEIIFILIQHSKNVSSGQTKEGYPFINYFGYTFQWIPKDKENCYNILK